MQQMRLDRIGLTMAPAAPRSEAAKATGDGGAQSTLKAPEETAINQVELGLARKALAQERW